MKARKSGRFFAILLALCLIFSALPISASAAGTLDVTIVGTVNGTTTLTGQDNLSKAIDAAGETTTSVTSIEVTGGPVTAADWATAKACTAMTSIKVRSSATSVANIPANNFNSITTLATADIAKVTSIGEGAFGGCAGLTTANFMNLTSISKDAFYGSGPTAGLNVAAPNVTTIGEGAFASSNIKPANFSKLTSISKNAFNTCTKLTSITAPNVTTIGEGAFANSAITAANFPKVTTIPKDAFYNCTALATAIFPSLNAGTSIATGAFANCGTLSILRFPKNLPTPAAGAFTGTPGGSITFVDVSNALLSSGDLLDAAEKYDAYTGGGGTDGDGFWTVDTSVDWTLPAVVPTNYVNLVVVDGTIGTGTSSNGHFDPGAVVTIKAKTISGKVFETWVIDEGTSFLSPAPTSAALKSETLTLNISSTFTGIRTIKIRAQYTNLSDEGMKVKINGGAEITAVDLVSALRSFFGVTSLTSAQLNNVNTIEVTGGNMKVYSDFDFMRGHISDLTGLTSYKVNKEVTVTDVYSPSQQVFPDNIETISIAPKIGYGKAICKNCTKLKNLTINAADIGDQAFMNCTSLKTINISADNLSPRAFQGCTSLESVTINNANLVAKYAFFGCTKLKTVSIPNAGGINEHAFESCINLTSVSMPKVAYIEEAAFSGCSKLTTASIPGAESVGKDAFRDCSRLKSVDVKNTEFVGESAFFGCGELTSISLQYCTEIKKDAFLSCGKLASISLPKEKPTVEANAFLGCPTPRTATVPPEHEYGAGPWLDWTIKLGAPIPAKVPVSSGTTTPSPTPAVPCTLTFETNGGSSVGALTRNSGTTITLNETPTRSGYTFIGWYTDSAMSEANRVGAITLSKDTTVYAKWELTTDVEKDTKTHTKYINGYEDHTFKPGNNMTRAEVAQMFYNLLDDKTVTETKTFSDVSSKDWYYKAVTTLAGKGIIEGYKDGTFKPGANITRAEFTKIAVDFAEVKAGGTCTFTDLTDSHWAYGYISAAVGKGWIAGYKDKTFKPEAPITRAEAVTIANGVLERSTDTAGIDAGRTSSPFSDVKPNSHWASYEIIEAGTTHKYILDGSTEVWLTK